MLATLTRNPGGRAVSGQYQEVITSEERVSSSGSNGSYAGIDESTKLEDGDPPRNPYDNDRDEARQKSNYITLVDQLPVEPPTSKDYTKIKEMSRDGKPPVMEKPKRTTYLEMVSDSPTEEVTY